MKKSKINSNASSQTRHWLDAVITVGVILLVVLAPLPLGSVNRWSAEILLAGALVLFALWALRCALTGTVRICRTRVWWFMGAFLLLGVLQTIPFPTGVVQTLSPKTREIQAVAETAPFSLNMEGATPVEPQNSESTATNAPSPGTSTLSVSSWASQSELRRLLLFALMTWLIANTFTQRWQVLALATAIIGIGAFEALYGLGEQFSGHKHIFGMPRAHHLFAATGTFVNKNHFCGFVGMVLLLAIGVWVGLRADRRKGGAANSTLGWRVRLGLMLSNARTAQMLGVSLAVGVLVFGVLFSISRAGIVLSLSVAVLLLLWTAYGAGLRGNTLLLLGVLGGIGLAASAIGLDLVATHLESAASGEDASWLMRQSMLALGLEYFLDFPLFGSGLGTGKWTVFAYQGASLGDIWVDYLHNDWLQIACEAGVPGLTLAVVGAVAFVLEAVSGTKNARTPMGRWIGRGALAAVAYMLLHSFFDFNLTAITSNGLLFASMIGLALAAPRIPRSSRRRRSSRGGPSDAEKEKPGWLVIPMSAPVPRAGILLAGIGLLVALLPACVSAIRTDYNLKQYLVSIDRARRFPLGLSAQSEKMDSAKGKQALRRAVQSSPTHPFAQYWKGRDILVEARRKEDELARSLAANVLPELADEKNTDAMESLIPAFMPAARRQLQQDRRKTVPAGLACLKRTAMQVPAYPWTYNHAAELRKLLVDADTEATVELVRRAMLFAPHKPAILSRGAIVLLDLALRGSAKPSRILDITESVMQQDRYALLNEWLREENPSSQTPEQRFSLALMAASKALVGNPELSKELFPLLHRLTDNTVLVRTITPETIRAQERLYAYLWRKNELVEALEVLDRIEKRVREFGNAGTGTRMTYARGAVPRDDHEILSSVYRRKARVHAQLGQFDAYRIALGRLRAAIRPSLEERCRSIEHLRGLGRRREAFEKSRDLLQSYWWYTPARVLAAELADLPAVRADAPPFQSALDHIYRAILWHTPALSRPQMAADSAPREERQTAALITPIVHQHVQRLQEVLSHAEDSENPSLLHSLCAILLPSLSENAGSQEQKEAIKKLASLAQDNKSLLPHHRIGHLLPFYTAILNETLGNKQAAAAAYRETLEISPRHLPALMRLLSVENSDQNPLQKRLDDLLPENPIMATFGGRLLFLGAEQREVETTKTNRFGLKEPQIQAETTYYWMPLDRFHNQYFAWIRYENAAKQLISHDQHSLRDGASDRTINETVRPGSVGTVQQTRADTILTSESMRVAVRLREDRPTMPLWMDSGNRQRIIRLPRPRATPSRTLRKNSSQQTPGAPSQVGGGDK